MDVWEAPWATVGGVLHPTGRKETGRFFTSCAAQDLHSQVEVVSELHWEEAQISCPDRATQPAGHRAPAQHPHLEHLQQANVCEESAPVSDGPVGGSNRAPPEQDFQASRPRCSR